MKNLFGKFITALVVLALILGVFSMITPSFNEPTVVSLSQVASAVKSGEITSVVVKENTKLFITTKDNKQQIATKEVSESVSEMLTNLGVTAEELKTVDIRVDNEKGVGASLTSWLPFILPFVIVLFVIFFFLRQVQGANNKAMSFGQTQARMFNQNAKNKITFADVEGNKEAKIELEEIVEFLKHPQKFTSLGAKIPKGVLLMGSPGTGKTLMAKAVAGEAGVPFFSISGSEFVEMFVGVGASRVRDLFKKAKKSAPCIIFIDEIDAVGRQRGAGLGGSHDEREQTLNQILVEMDGMETKVNVIVMAATNRPDVLDPALLRPGRFDRRVVIDMPDIKDREAILKVHAKDKPLASDVALDVIAQRTPGFSGADLANLLNEAAIATARANKKQIAHQTVLDSIEKVLLGPERKSHIMSEKEKLVTAYHEAGHAVVAHYQPHTDPVHKVSIISRGRAGGYTLKLPTQDKSLHTKQEFIEDLAMILGGQAAEEVFFKDVSTGPSSDLRKATELAKAIVMEYGMNDRLGPRTFGDKNDMVFLGKDLAHARDYSESIAQVIDEEIEKLVKEAKKTAVSLVTKYKDQMDAVVKELMTKETLERAEFEAICGAKPSK
ncbi:ATP-dependent zinc metalloprotease FtsH [Candidatus Falkowbacteria bacterium]|nr:ATP-dependent zinc metalloprotease FtsH [Candidatus Falkowbacteria bacterium]